MSNLNNINVIMSNVLNRYNYNITIVKFLNGTLFINLL